MLEINSFSRENASRKFSSPLLSFVLALDFVNISSLLAEMSFCLSYLAIKYLQDQKPCSVQKKEQIWWKYDKVFKSTFVFYFLPWPSHLVKELEWFGHMSYLCQEVVDLW